MGFIGLCKQALKKENAEREKTSRIQLGKGVIGGK